MYKKFSFLSRSSSHRHKKGSGFSKARKKKWFSGRRGRRILWGLLIFIFFIGGPLWLWQQGIFQEAYDRSRSFLHQNLCQIGLQIQTVRIEGIERTTQEDVHQALGDISQMVMTSFSPEQARQRVMHLPWVRSAWVQRLYPDCVRIHISEHEPMAIWQNKGRYYVIHDEGGVISRANPRSFAHLVVMTGSGAPKEAPKFLAVLWSYPQIAERVTQAIYQTHRRWDIVLDRRVKIKLPENNLSEALEELMLLDQRGHLRNKDMSEIDLRLPDRWFFKLSSEAYQKCQEIKKK